MTAVIALERSPLSLFKQEAAQFYVGTCLKINFQRSELSPSGDVLREQSWPIGHTTSSNCQQGAVSSLWQENRNCINGYVMRVRIPEAAMDTALYLW